MLAQYIHINVHQLLAPSSVHNYGTVLKLSNNDSWAKNCGGAEHIPMCSISAVGLHHSAVCIQRWGHNIAARSVCVVSFSMLTWMQCGYMLLHCDSSLMHIHDDMKHHSDRATQFINLQSLRLRACTSVQCSVQVLHPDAGLFTSMQFVSAVNTASNRSVSRRRHWEIAKKSGTTSTYALWVGIN